MNQIVLNELELRSVIRRRILREEMRLLNESGTLDVIGSLEGIASGGTELDNGATTLALEAGSVALSGFSAIPDWALATGLAGLSLYFTGSPFTGLAAFPFVAGSLVSAQKYIDKELAQAEADSKNDDLAGLNNFFHQKTSVDFTADLKTKVVGGEIIFPAIVEDDGGDEMFEVDNSGEVVESFLGLESSSFDVLLKSSVSKTEGDKLASWLANDPREHDVNTVLDKVKEIYGNKDISLSEFAHIEQIVYDKRGDYDFKGSWSYDDFTIKKEELEGASDGESVCLNLLGALYDEDGNDALFVDTTNLLAMLNPIKKNILSQKIKYNVFKISSGLTGFDKMKASLEFYDSSKRGWRETADGDITIGQAFFKEALKTRTFKEMKNRLEKVKDVAKEATSALIDMIPKDIRSEEIDTILTELQAVMDADDSTALQCAAAIMLALLKIGKEGLTTIISKAAELGGDLLNYLGFGDEDDNETTTTTTTPGRTTSATTRSTTAGTRSNTERIQTLLNQYWTREGLTSPALLEVDGKWGDLTDFMWFAVLQHASDYNAWYNKTVTSDGEDSGSWPATAASLRDIDGEEFDGKTTGCIQFLEKLLDAETEAGTPSVDTPSGGGDTGAGSGTTTQQQSRGEATGMQGLIKVVGTGMTDVMYLEDIGYSEGTSESLARDIINAADRGYTGSGEPLNFTVEIFKNSNSREYRKVKVKRAKGENRRDLSGLEKIPGVIKNFLEKKKPNFNDDNFQNTMRKERRTTKIYEFNLAITVPG